MADPRSRRVLVERLSGLALLLGAGAILAALIAAVGSGQGLWHFTSAFFVLRIAFYAALAGGVAALMALLIPIRGRRRRSTSMALAGLVLSALFASYIGIKARSARAAAPIHDITTNLDDMPQFYRLRVRDDNLANIPNLGRSDLDQLSPEERWMTIHREAYPDLTTVRVPWSPPETIRRAADLARARDWDFATISPDGGVMEATETSLFFRFRDDVVLRARRAPQGGSFVDMRSVSRVGVSDTGANAKRIRDFLQDLQEG